MLKIKSTITVLLSVLILISSTPIIAYADVVWSNEFVGENDFEPLNRRRFIVNSPDGYVIPQREPGQSLVVHSWTDSRGNEHERDLRRHMNGAELSLTHAYLHEGEYWGLIGEFHGDNSYAWVPMDHLLVIYTPEDFFAENEDKLFTYTGDLSALLVTRRLVCWQWPGSDREKIVMNAPRLIFPPREFEGRAVIDSEEDILAYTDYQGRVWGYIEYFQHRSIWSHRGEEGVFRVRRHAWVCLTEPWNADIPAFHPAPEPIKWSSDGTLNWTHPQYEHEPISDRSLQIARPEDVFESNGFFVTHRNDILYLGRSFLANSDNGFVSVKDSPDSGSEIARLKNGDIVFVDFSCLYDSEFWGLISVDEDSYTKTGWVKLDEFLVLYDYVAFEEDNIDHLYQYTGDLEEIDEAGAMIAWSWPGSGFPLWTVEGVSTSTISIAYAYTDDDGREWGFIRYLYGGGNIWVCLSDPVNPDIPGFNPTSAPEVWVSDTEHTDIANLRNFPLVIIIVLVAVLALSSVILMRIFWKPNVETQQC